MSWITPPRKGTQGQSVTLPEIAVVVPEMGYLVPNATIATTTDTPILDMCRCGRAERRVRLELDRL